MGEGFIRRAEMTHTLQQEELFAHLSFCALLSGPFTCVVVELAHIDDRK